MRQRSWSSTTIRSDEVDVEDFLQLEGFAAAEAGNGQEALNYLRGGGDANVILLDLACR